MVRGVFQITLLVLACAWLAVGDVAHLKAAKAKLVGRLKHHKRGIFSSVPPFKLGHDIPLVTHSLVKPLVVTYPPTAALAAVKVPLSPPLVPRYPIHGHKVPLPHPHFGIRYPHHTKTVIGPKPDQHFHHHHHHIPPKPLVPVLPAAPVVPVPQPSTTILQPFPAPTPSVIVPEPAVHSHPVPIAPPPVHIPFKPFVPIAPIQPASAIHSPVIPYAQQFPYVIRPGNAVQTSFFATYPRYPLGNYQSSLYPLPLPAPAAPVIDQVLLNRPQLHLIQGGHEVVEHGHPSVVVEPTPTLLHPTQAALPQPAVHIQTAQPTVHLQPAHPTVHLEPAQPTVHLQPAQPTVHVQPTQPAVPLDHDGWSPVPAQPHDLIPAHQPDGHFLTPVQQEGHFHQDGHFPQPIDGHHFTQEQGTQVFEQHTGSDQQYHDYQHQLQHHIQQQIEQAQYEQHLNNQHQLNQEYGAPQQEYAQPNQDFSQQNPDFAQHAHEYSQHVQEYAQHGQDYAQTNEYNLQQQPAQEYGIPQQLEGRSAEGEEEGQRFHNHIPLGLQPPIDRPLEHFR